MVSKNMMVQDDTTLGQRLIAKSNSNPAPETIVEIMVDPHSSPILDSREIIDSLQDVHNLILDKI